MRTQSAHQCGGWGFNSPLGHDFPAYLLDLTYWWLNALNHAVAARSARRPASAGWASWPPPWCPRLFRLRLALADPADGHWGPRAPDGHCLSHALVRCGPVPRSTGWRRSTATADSPKPR